MKGPICIIGGGVAGTALATALARRGLSAIVVERNGVGRFIGGALLLWSNAMRVIRAIGLEEEVRSLGIELDAIDFRNDQNTLLWRLDVGELGRSSGAPCLVLPRARLLECLERSARATATFLPDEFERYELSPADVKMQLASGRFVSSGILVGADGVRSRVRQQLTGQSTSTRSAGQAIWVGSARLVHSLLRPGRPVAWMGRGLRFWAAALPGDIVYWYALFWNRAAPRDLWELSSLYGKWQGIVRDIILSTPNDVVIKRELGDLRPSRVWGDDRVTLIGDAIHPVTPDLGQGACQAIESALMLAECLAEKESEIAALRKYENGRRRRTARVSQMSYLTAVASMLEHPFAGMLREVGTTTVLPWLARPELEWLLSGSRPR